MLYKLFGLCTKLGFLSVYPCHLNPVSASGRVAGSNPFSMITVARFARICKKTNCLMYWLLSTACWPGQCKRRSLGRPTKLLGRLHRIWGLLLPSGNLVHKRKHIHVAKIMYSSYTYIFPKWHRLLGMTWKATYILNEDNLYRREANQSQCRGEEKEFYSCKQHAGANLRSWWRCQGSGSSRVASEITKQRDACVV